MKKHIVSSDPPLAEITLRKYPSPNQQDQRELVKRICLSLGLLQPSDSRDVIVDVLQVFLNNKVALHVDEVVELIQENRTRYKLPQQGVANSNIRRQINRLRDLLIVEKINTTYRLSEGMSLEDIFTHKIEEFFLRGIIKRVKEYCKAVQNK